MTTISIFGLGYVGSVSVACWADRNHKVIGVDVNPTKLAMIKEGHSPIIEAGLDELLEKSVAAGRIEAHLATRSRPSTIATFLLFVWVRPAILTAASI